MVLKLHTTAIHVTLSLHNAHSHANTVTFSETLCPPIRGTTHAQTEVQMLDLF